MTVLSIVLVVVLPYSCQKEFTGPPLTNTAPVVFAGNDTSVISYDINLKGIIEDQESNVRDIHWSQHSARAPAYLLTPTSVNTAAVFSEDGVYYFILTATDAGGLSDRDTVRVSVTIPVVQGIRDSVVVDSIPWTYDPGCVIVVPDADKVLPANKDFQIRVRPVGAGDVFGPVIPEKTPSNSNLAHYVLHNNTIEIYYPTIDCNFDLYEYFDISISWER